MNANTKPEQLAISAHDTEDCNRSANLSISDIIDARLSRRSLFKAGVGTAGTAVLGSFALSACGGGGSDSIEKLQFANVAKSTADVLSVPAGYTATVLYALGDPLTSRHA
jgi:secreted PhoX family phosphatase